MSYPESEQINTNHPANEVDPFRLPLKPIFARPLEWLLGLSKLSSLYRARPKKARGREQYQEFLSHALKVLDTGLEPDSYAALAEIPAQGPVIFVANHPFGGLEGIAMTELLLHLRPDTKVLTNEMLTRVPELGAIFFGVDVFSNGANIANARGMRALFKHLAQGGAVLIYPAGEVSSFNTRTGTIQDPNWNHLVGRLARKYKADCFAFYVQGRNSWWFYFLGTIHPFLRTLRLPKELTNKRGKRFRLLVGPKIKASDLIGLRNDREATEYLRNSSDILARRAGIQPPKTRVVKVGQAGKNVTSSETAHLK